MKKLLLATVAVGALVAGPALAQRQEAPPSDTKGAAPPPPAIQKAPAEKSAPAGKVAPDRAPGTTGQAAPSGRTPGEPPGATDKPGTKVDTKSDTQTRSGATTESRGAGAPATLTTEQRSKIRSTVLTANAPRVTNVNFSINIGAVVPRTVRLVAVPAPLIEIHPAWRGLMYFVHGDTIVIVEPGTLRIVAVVSV